MAVQIIQTKKLRTKWKVDAEDELAKLTGSIFAKEFDREIIDKITEISNQADVDKRPNWIIMNPQIAKITVRLKKNKFSKIGFLRKRQCKNWEL